MYLNCNSLHSSQIYLYFDESIKEKYSDASDDMSRLYKAIEEHDFFRNTNVYIDSFTSFTPVQHKIIENMNYNYKNICIKN